MGWEAGGYAGIQVTGQEGRDRATVTLDCRKGSERHGGVRPPTCTGVRQEGLSGIKPS